MNTMTLQEDLHLQDQWTKISQQELDKILEKHQAYLDNKEGGSRARLGMHDFVVPGHGRKGPVQGGPDGGDVDPLQP